MSKEIVCPRTGLDCEYGAFCEIKAGVLLKSPDWRKTVEYDCVVEETLAQSYCADLTAEAISGVIECAGNQRGLAVQATKVLKFMQFFGPIISGRAATDADRPQGPLAE